MLWSLLKQESSRVFVYFNVDDGDGRPKMDNHVGMHASTTKNKVKGRDAKQLITKHMKGYIGYFERGVIFNDNYPLNREIIYY